MEIMKMSFRSKLLLIVVPLIGITLLLLFLTSAFINDFANQVIKLGNEELVNQKHHTLLSEAKDIATESNALLYQAKDTLLKLANKEDRAAENYLTQIEVFSGKISTITGQLISLQKEDKAKQILENYSVLKSELLKWGDDINQKKLSFAEASESFKKERKLLKTFIKENTVFEEGKSSVTPEILNFVNAARSDFRFKGIAFIVIILLISVLSFFLLLNMINFETQNAIAMFEAVRSQNMIEKAPINILMVTLDGILGSINENARTNLRKLEQYLPERVDNFVGKSTEVFIVDREIQRHIAGDPKNLPYKALMNIGPETVDVLVAAIYDAYGVYIGPMVSWEIVTEKVTLVKNLTKSAQNLSDSSAIVLSISSNLSAAAEETSAQANTASVAAEEVNSGVQTVASNMEDMVNAIKEITRTTNEAASMTMEAMNITNSTNTIINQLGESSMDIGNVIKVISSIAQQTNLLALNATIEAARAGEAGKGFAVVANEVKELAKQTAIATNEITKKIENIQNDSKNAVDAIAKISSAIEKVNGHNGSIAAAVEEQAATTNEVKRIVSESADGVMQISENISQVSSAAASTGKDAGKTQEAAQAVGNIAIELNKYVASLKI
jgi:methyl-accepting chemotaxis protein